MWQVLHHETRLKLKRTEVIESTFFKYTRIKLETTTTKKNSWEIFKYLEMQHSLKPTTERITTGKLENILS